ncbi:MAG: GGDEF domain-containing protein [Candidatus Nanohaloarchaea archaeon]|nr:GGDEF domain-containing protein [Candidatus Nanohaloarchaea archaeon]
MDKNSSAEGGSEEVEQTGSYRPREVLDGKTQVMDRSLKKDYSRQKDRDNFVKGLKHIRESSGEIWADRMRKKTFKYALERERNKRDSFTGLLDDRAFDEEIKEEIARAERREDYNFVVAVLDLDYFKPINDNLGHEVGDQIIRNTANVLEESTRAYDKASFSKSGPGQNSVAGRKGGDEFSLLLSDVSSRENIKKIEERLVEKYKQVRDEILEEQDIEEVKGYLKEVYSKKADSERNGASEGNGQIPEQPEQEYREIQADIEEDPYDVMRGQDPEDLISIGFAAYPGDGDTVEDLVTTADSRMYEDKGRSRR